MRRRALVLGGIADVLAPSRALGIETILFLPQQAMKPELRALADECYMVSLDDHDATVALAERIYREKPFDCVLSFTELAMVPAAMIGERLRLPGASTVSTARLLRDKLSMRDRLNSAGLSPVRTRFVRSLDDATKQADDMGYPVILKPRYGTGSMGVRRADSAEELSEAVATALSADPQGLLIEEFMAGPEFSVEAFSFDGAHRVIAVTGKKVTENFVETGHVVPADVTTTEHAAICDLVRSFLDLIGLTDGPSHTEVIISDGCPRIVESHDRLGGDKIYRLVELAYGVSMMSWCYQWPLGMMGTPAEPVAMRAACIRYLLADPGRIERISVPGYVRADAGLDGLEIVLSVGDHVRPLSSSLDRPGFIVVTAADPHAAVGAAERLASGVRIETVPCLAS